jgi:hypothetical protein
LLDRGERDDNIRIIMKNTLGKILSVVILFAASALYGGSPLPEVSVTVKQPPNAKPIKQIVTDAKGNFVVDGLSPGTYAFTFRSPKLRELKTEKFFIAISGTKRPIKPATFSDRNLRDGIEVSLEVGPAAEIRGQVVAGQKKMVWIPPLTGSRMPGRWVEEGASGAEMAPGRNVGLIPIEAIREMQSRGTGM